MAASDSSTPSALQQSTPATSDSSTSPFFLPSSDLPGHPLISQLLNGDNYATWFRAMRMALMAKNKYGFVDGTLLKPDPTDRMSSQWERCNQMVYSWILNSINADIANSVMYADTAQEVWTDLHDRFSQQNAPRVYQISRAIALHVQDSLPVSVYFTKLKALWDELSSYTDIPTCTCGSSKALSALHQQEKLMQFLMGLNDSFSAIRSQILLMDPLPTVSRAYALILQEERQRDLHVNPHSNEISALLASTTPRGTYPTTDSRGKSRPKVKCNHCGKENHTIDRCYRLHGFPPKQQLAKHSQRPSRPVAANATQSDEAALSQVSPASPLSQEQYQQLLTLLTAGAAPSMANLAGNITCFSVSSPSPWIDLSHKQLDEVAFGLEMSEHGFIWVVRSRTWNPPSEIEKKMMERGLIVREWVDQRRILAHKAIGGFLSHCGWNSVLESLSMGVPILAWPMVAEQHLNAKFLVEELKVAEQVPIGTIHGEENIIRREVICEGVRELMGGEKGRKARQKAEELGKMGRRAVQEGGSSYGSLNKLIDQLHDICR
ncbi:hypothetical protein HHK36_013733 [Tetracentron sinense]|uniref:Glycosyltransferase n=1 Tax=Tetracentron sinense TaxID=13715 RepID=A0A834Z6J4_TETSI|nr:hypothetical protein HHK36_013733 [Tetracentron sinense]